MRKKSIEINIYKYYTKQMYGVICVVSDEKMEEEHIISV